MTTLNLVRNSKLFFTTNVDSNGKIQDGTPFTAANTQELQVLVGFSFSQTTTADTITISEAGSAPVRGQRAFNTALSPVNYSFSTYIRPRLNSGVIKAEEAVLWNALLGDQGISSGYALGGTGVTASFVASTNKLAIDMTGGTLPAGLKIGQTVVIGGFTGPTASLTKLNAPATITSYKQTSDSASTTTANASLPTTDLVEITLSYTNPSTTDISPTEGTITFYPSAWAPAGGSSFSTVTSANSNKNQLQQFGLLFMIDQVLYAVDNCALNQVTIDFGLGAIATAAWTGQGTQLRKIADAATASAGTFNNGITGVYTQKATDAGYITNKLSTVSMSLVNQLNKIVGGTSTAVGANADPYAIALTGGSITINNNITYITPAILGVVNLPQVYYTGTRAITGSMQAYLKTGSGRSTGELLADLLDAASTTTEPMFALTLSIGGSSYPTRVDIELPSINVTIPTIDATQPVVTTTINFTSQGSVQSAASGVYDISKTNDFTARYYSTTSTAS